ncbi:MAG TPA: 5-(carboxyamino)imidazole ribonucleotide synthase [Gammaproteobacteria bacterium]|nr:5-(carboxyamino)imidazole ribonucleotide synthase [Gammaproteobacteria bacterium]
MTRIGIIGAGQLGRMLALAGYPLGLRFVFLDKSEDAPGGQVGDIILGEFSDPAKLAELAARVDVVTFDVENVPAEAVRRGLGDRTPFWPPVTALAAAQDRLHEKDTFRRSGIPTPDYRAVDSMLDLERAVQEIGYPAVLKTRRMGYDGKGQRVIRSPADLGAAFNAIGGVPLILESFVPFEREVSIIGVRSTRGETRCYPLAENEHRDGILRVSFAPCEDSALQALAEDYLQRLFEAFDYAGVLTIEFFVHGGRLLANEMAPRVHNSGHWTIEGAATSQFENHVRAILGLPLGDTRPLGYAAMVNFIGSLPPLAAVLGIAGAHYHSYGKEPRPGRKLGHCTLLADDRRELAQRVAALQALAGTGG